MLVPCHTQGNSVLTWREKFALCLTWPYFPGLIYSFVPRQQKADTRTPEQIAAEAKRELALLQARNAVRAAKAEATGAGLRGIIGGFARQALQVDERKARRQAAAAARQARRARVAEQEQMRAVADAALLRACTDEDGTVDAALLEARLREAGKWPPSPAHWQADRHEELSAPDQEAIITTGMPRWWTEDKVAEALGISPYQAHQRMKPSYKGRYARIKSRESSFHGKPVCKAYYQTIEALCEKETVQSGAQDNVQVTV